MNVKFKTHKYEIWLNLDLSFEKGPVFQLLIISKKLDFVYPAKIQEMFESSNPNKPFNIQLLVHLWL